CHALIYSRKPKLCGQCGALLPPELLLTDQQAQARADQRAWARDLADKFGAQSSLSTRPPTNPLSHTALRQAPTDTTSPEELLRRVSCVEDFRTRDRPAFWLYVVGYALSFFLIAFLFFKLNLLPPEVLLLMTTAFAILCFGAWHFASPICPNCKQNIRICAGEC